MVLHSKLLKLFSESGAGWLYTFIFFSFLFLNTNCLAVSPAQVISPVSSPTKRYNVCLDTITLRGNKPSANEKGEWSFETTGKGEFLDDPTKETVRVKLTAPGIINIYWTITSDADPSDASFSAAYLNNGSPSLPVISGNDTVICNSSLNLKANLPQFGTGKWIAAGVALGNASSNTTLASGLPRGTTKIYWEIKAGAECKARRDSILVTNNASTLASAGADTTVCSNAINLKGNILSVSETGLWTSLNNSQIINPTSSFATVTELLEGNNLFIWKITHQNCSSSDTIAVKYQKVNIADILTENDTSVCHAQVRIRAGDVNNGQWTIVSGSGIIQNPLSAKTNITGLAQGLNTFRWTVNNFVCGTSQAQVNIINNTITQPVTAKQSCGLFSSGQNITLALQNTLKPQESGQWNKTSTQNFILTPDVPSNTATFTPPLSGIYRFRFTANNGSNCTADDTLRYVLITKAEVPQRLCRIINVNETINDSVIAVNPPVSAVGENGMWQLISATPALPPSAIWNFTPAGKLKFNNFPAGTYRFKWSISNLNCASCSATCINEQEVTISIHRKASINKPLITCTNNTEFPLSAVAIGTAETGSFSSNQPNTFTPNQTSPSVTVKNLFTGKNTITWQVTHAPGCISRDSVSITRVTKPNAGEDKCYQFFNVLNDTLKGNKPNNSFNEKSVWYITDPKNPGTYPNVKANPGNDTSRIVVTSTPPGNYILRYSIFTDECKSLPEDSVNVTFVTSPQPVPDSYQLFPLKQAITISAFPRPVNTDTAYWINSSGDKIASGNTMTLPATIRQGMHSYKFVIKNKKNTCSFSTSANIRVITNPEIEGPSCLNSQLNGFFIKADSISAPAGETGRWTIKDPENIIQNFVGTAKEWEKQVSINTPGKAVVYWTITSGNFTVRDSLVITKLTSPAIQVTNSCAVVPMAVLKPVTPLLLKSYESGYWIKKSGLSDTTVKMKQGIGQTDTLINTKPGQQMVSLVIKDNSTNSICADTSLSPVVITSVSRAKIATGKDTCVSTGSIKLSAIKHPAERIKWVSPPPFNEIVRTPNLDSTTIFLTNRDNLVHLFVKNVNDSTCFTKDSLVISKVTQAKPFEPVCIKATTSISLIGDTTITNLEKVKWYALSSANDTIFKSNGSKATFNSVSQGENKFYWETSYLSALSGKICKSTSELDAHMVPKADMTLTDSCFIKEVGDKIIKTTTLNDSSKISAQWIEDPLFPNDVITQQTPKEFAISVQTTGSRKFIWKLLSKKLESCSTSTNVTFTVIPESNAGLDTCMVSSLNLSVINLKGSSIDTTKGEKGIWRVPAGVNLSNNAISTPLAHINQKRKYPLVWEVSNNFCKDADTSYLTFLNKAVIKNSDSCVNFSNGSSIALRNNLTANAHETGTWSSQTASINRTSDTTAQAPLSMGINQFVWTITERQGLDCSSSDTVTYAALTSPASFSSDTIFACTTDTVLVTSPVSLQEKVSWKIRSGFKVSDLNLRNDSLFLPRISNDTIYTLIREISPTSVMYCSNIDSVKILNRQLDSINIIPSSIVTCKQSVDVKVNRPGNDIKSATGNWIEPFIQPIDNSISVENSLSNSNTSTLAYNISKIVSAGTYKLTWQTSNTFCSPRRAEIIIEKKDDLAVKVKLFSVCNQENFPFRVLDSTDVIQNVDSVRWTVEGVTGTKIENADSNNKEIVVANGLIIGTNNFKYTAYFNGCTGTTSIFVKNTESFELNRGRKNALLELCEGDSAIYTAAHPLRTSVNPDFKISFSNKKDINSNDPDTRKISLSEDSTQVIIKNLINSLNNTKTIYILAQNGDCSLEMDSIKIKNYKSPEIVYAGPDDTICTGKIELKGQTDNYATGSWKVLEGNNQGFVVNDSLATFNTVREAVNIFEFTGTNGKCFKSDTVSFLAGDSLSPAISVDSINVCDSSSIKLQAEKPAYGKGIWLLGDSVIADTNIINNHSYTQPTVNILENGAPKTFTWKVYNKYCSTSSQTIATLYKSPTEAVAGEDQAIVTDFTVLKANPPLLGTGKWKVLAGTANVAEINNPASSINNLSFGENILSWTVINGVCPALTDLLKIEYSELMVPDGFSPNGDGKNDRFEIKGLENHPGTKLKILNRWGVLIYSSENYMNDWDGGKHEDDTYYYEVSIPGSAVKHGYLLMKRK